MLPQVRPPGAETLNPGLGPASAQWRTDRDRVEAVLEGPPDDVHRLVDRARRGPAAATVTGVTVREERPEGLGDFVLR